MTTAQEVIAERINELKEFGFVEEADGHYKEPISEYVVKENFIFESTNTDWDKQMDFIDYILSK
jgi:hypothetical protein